MSENGGKLFVFERKELVLLVFFFIIMSVTSFVFGMRLGKKQVLENVNVAQVHAPAVAKQDLDFKSEKEEYVDNVIAEAKKEESGEQKPAKLEESTLTQLKNELEALDKTDFNLPPAKEAAKIPVEEATPAAEVAAPAVAESTQPAIKIETDEALPEDKTVLKPTADILGKFTIQLGSYRSYAEAKQFAEGFIIKGYRPLINQVDVSGKGTWYRVSLGVFESIRSAKAYTEKESSLFASQEYVISEIK